MGLTGRDLVAVILAFGVVIAFLAVVGAVVRGEYVMSGDAVVGGIFGAVVVVLARYVLERRNGH